MGPKRSSRSVPYDLAMPENWTVAKLTTELNKLNINIPAGSRKGQLINIYKQAINRNTNSAHDTTIMLPVSSAPAIQTAVNASATRTTTSAQDGNTNTNIATAVQTLTQTMLDMRREMLQLKTQISTLTPSAAAGSPEQLPRQPATENTDVLGLNYRQPLRLGINPPASSITSESGTDFTISTAYTRFNSANNEPSYTKTRYGFSSESLPFVETVNPTLRKSIQEGKDINLASLMIPYYNPDKTTPHQDTRLDRNLNIGEFIQAFGVYKNIMCEKYPQRRSELDLYERDIVDMSARYNGPGFYDYHKQFSAKAAAYLKFNNILVDWSVRNNTMFCNIFANIKPTTCNNCGSSSHTIASCPQATGHNNNTYHRPGNKESDSYGRKRVYHYGQEICNNYNGDRGCSRANCIHAHVCVGCRKDHPKSQCSQNQASKNLSGLHKSQSRT